MQRRLAAQRKPQSSSNTSPIINTATATTTTPVPTATVVRHKCGTSPFDKHWLNFDCCGLFCAAFTYCLHLYGCYAVCHVLLPPWMSISSKTAIGEGGTDGDARQLTFWGMFHSTLFCTIALLAVLSHFKAMTTDPGAVPPDAEPIGNNKNLDSTNLETGGVSESGIDVVKEPSVTAKPFKGPKRLCRRCNAFKPDRAHHCSICKRCIIKMDHHCPWINNCVGIGNHKYFLLFIFYTFISCTYSMTLVIARFINCLGHIEKHEPCLDQPAHLLSLIGLVVESILFGMFTCCMMIDQWDVVLTKVTHIDRLKGEFLLDDIGGSGTITTGGINEVFGVGFGDNGKRKKGSSFRPDWLSPFANVCFPESMKDDIMGFCRPCFHISKAKEEDGESGRKVVNSVADIV